MPQILGFALRYISVERSAAMERQPNNPSHGVTLEQIVTELVDKLGWARMARSIPINCFKDNPSVKSSLTFLRRTPWARAKVENLYLRSCVGKSRSSRQ